MTNGDRIRSMTDVQLADFIHKNIGFWTAILLTHKYVNAKLNKWLKSEYIPEPGDGGERK